MVKDLSRLYLEAIRHHAAHPVGFGEDIGATHQYEEYNALCGDRIRMQLRISEGQIEAAAFDGEACTICMASASLLCEHVPGHDVAHLNELHDALQEMLQSDDEVITNDALEPLRGVRPYPSRIRCATLPWSAACKAL